jgi:hypothetical protein
VLEYFMNFVYFVHIHQYMYVYVYRVPSTNTYVILANKTEHKICVL